MKTGQTRVRLNQENLEFLRRLEEQTGLKQIEISTMLLHAALAAIREQGGRASFPVKFVVPEFPGELRYGLSERPRTTSGTRQQPKDK